MVCRLHSVEQLFLDPRFDPFAEQRAVGQDDRAASAVLQQVHDQHQEQVGGFAGLKRLGEVHFDAVLFHAAERRIGDDHVDAILRAVVAQRSAERVVVADLRGYLDAVQQHVGRAENVRQVLLFDAVDRRLQSVPRRRAS